MREKRERVDVGSVNRRERRRAPHARVDALTPERAHKRQRAVDAAPPQHVAVQEFLRVMGHQPALAFTVADLLPPVGRHRGAVVVPNERGRGEPDPPAPRLQSPAHVHIVTGAQVERVEATHGEQRVASEGHVAPRDVLSDAIVEQHVRRSPGRARDALGHGRIVVGDHVRATRPDDVRGQEGLNEVGEPVAVDTRVRVGVGDNLAGGRRQPHIAGGAQPGVRYLDDPDTRMLARDVAGGVRRAVVDENHLVVGVRQPIERG